MDWVLVLGLLCGGTVIGFLLNAAFTAGKIDDLYSELDNVQSRYINKSAELERLTDRDEKGRFVKREI